MPDSPTVLLVGKSLTLSNFFAENLRRRGCLCCLTDCYRDAVSLLEKTDFDLVLSEMHLSDGSAFPLMARLEKSGTTLYYCVGVYHGSWWLPAVERGRIAWGEAAMRPEDFRTVLAQVIADIAAKKSVASPRPSQHLASAQEAARKASA